MAEFVTHDQLAELERKMTSGFEGLRSQLTSIEHALETSRLESQAASDARYVKRDELCTLIAQNLDNPNYRRKCHSIASEYLDTEDGKDKIGRVIGHYLNDQRDSISKWIQFIKLVGGVIVFVSLIYGGSSFMKTQRITQKTMNSIIQNLE